MTDVAKRIVDFEERGTPELPEDMELMALWDCACRSLELYSPRLTQLLKIDELSTAIARASSEAKGRAMMAVFSAASAHSDKIDLTMVGGSKFAGNIQPKYDKLLSGGIDFIDQSVTGMFEKRTHIGL